jgi:L-lactate dehydrogenase complex protein LldG
VSSQEAFLARIRRALRKEPFPAAVRPPLLFDNRDLPQALEALWARLTADRAALVAQVQQELTAVGGVVACVPSMAEATAYITRLGREKNARLVVRWPSALLQVLEVEAAFQPFGIAVRLADAPSEAQAGAAVSEAELAGRRRELRTLLARADLGLTGVDYVIAETGTLVLSALPGQRRGVSLLPPVHVAVARTEQIVATMADYLLLLQAAGADWQRRLTSCVSFVTGPSRTGDIELTLTVGVHGPGELHLVLVDEAVAAGG